MKAQLILLYSSRMFSVIIIIMSVCIRFFTYSVFVCVRMRRLLSLPTLYPYFTDRWTFLFFLFFLQKWCSLLTRHFSNCKFQKIPQLFWRTRRKWHCDNCSLRISDFKAPGSISTTPYSGKETLYNVDIEFVFQTTVSENLEAATYCMLLFLKTSYETA